MKALITADLHLKFNMVSKKDGKYYIPILNIISSKIKELNPEYLFILGDIFHEKDRCSATVLELYRHFLLEVSKNTKVIQLVGNHDYSVRNENYLYNSLNLLNIDNVITVNDTFVLKNDTGDLGFMSYCKTKEDFNDKIEKLKDTKLLFGHLDINGFKLGDHYIEVNAIIDSSELSGFKKVFSGHYHEPQEKKYKGMDIIFVGSPETTDFGESDQEKRFILLDLNDFSFVNIPTGRTLHKTIKITAQDEFPVLPDDNVHYRVEIEGTKEEIDLMEKPKNYKAKIKVKLKQEKKERIKLNTKSNDNELIEEYTEQEVQRSYPNSEFDLEKLKKMGELYLKKARSK